MAYEKVRAYIENYKNGQFVSDIFVHDTPCDTVEHAAQVHNCEEAQIAKTMSFMLSSGPILIVSTGDVKVQNGKFKPIFHEKPSMIQRADVETLIGHAPGGVCPFAINDGVRVFLDESLKRYDIVYIAAGAENATMRVRVDDLFEMARAEAWVDACKQVEQ